MTIAEERAARLATEPLRDMNPPRGFVRGARTSVREIWERRELLNMLVRREIRARYKDSVLGLIWSLIRPLVQLLIYYLVLGKFLEAERAIPVFAIYIFCGLTAWGLFSEIVSVGTGSIVANAGIIKKIHLPREIFPLATVGSALFNFCIQFVILTVAAFAVGGINWENLWLLPLGVMILIVWGLALALVLSATNVYLRDTQYLVEVFILVGFWASPIVYSYAMVAGRVPGLFTELYSWNPITLGVMGLQGSMWGAADLSHFPPNLEMRMFVVLAIGCVALILGQRLFDRMQRDFAQEI